MRSWMVGVGIGFAAWLPAVSYAQTFTTSADSAFARYTRPGQCVQAAARLQREYWRDKRPDTIAYTPATDSVPAPVLATLRRCVARLSIATVPERELFDLARLYLWIGQDSLSAQVIRRMQRTGQSPEARGWTLYLLIFEALRAVPARVAFAQTLLGELDALGVPAAKWRLLAHIDRDEYAMSVGDLATAESQSRAALATNHQLSVNDRIDWSSTLMGAYHAATVPLAFTHRVPAAQALIDTAQADLITLHPQPDEREGFQSDITGERKLLAAIGSTGYAPVHAAAWFPSTGDTVYPRPGKVTLLITRYASCQSGCYPMYAVLRRLHAQYGDRLDVVIMSATEGSFREHLVPAPTAEADSIGRYFSEFIRVPAKIAVEVTEFTHIADGRRRNIKPPNLQNFERGIGDLLFDSHGVLVWRGEVEPRQEAVLDTMIRQTH